MHIKDKQTAIMLDKIIEECRITAAGNGYTDLICPKENIKQFVIAVTGLDIKIIGFTLWCYVTENHKPCGMGGPKNKFGNGYYSEMQTDIIELKNNKEVFDFLLYEWEKQENYKECLVPGFWLKL